VVFRHTVTGAGLGGIECWLEVCGSGEDKKF